MNKIYTVIVLFLGSITLFKCGDVPIFDEFATNRLRVVIKGTYESNSPAPWTSGFVEDDSKNTFTTGKGASALTQPLEFMLDIAEIRLQGDSTDKFAFYRNTYRFPFLDSEPFFSGEGIWYDNDDPYPDYQYHNVLLYIRKMIFPNAVDYIYYNSGWTFYETVETIFSENDVYGYDFNQLQYNTYWDSLREEADDVLRVFPLSVPISGGLIFNNQEEETVLEIRLVIKNFIKQFEYDYTDTDGYRHVVHYWGLSDWLRDVQADEEVIGGNVLSVARVYVPGKTATISGSVAAGLYVMAIESGDSIANYSLAVDDRKRPVQNSKSALTGCGPPKPPNVVDPTNIESLLDYYLQYQAYQVQYNNFITECVDDGTFKFGLDWDAYENKVGNFKIPPIVTCSTGTYTLENVPVGKTYYVYVSNTVSAKSVLPEQFTLLGGPITIDESKAGTTIIVP
ncbi:MAG TPA: hypothetical protein PLI62_17025 [Spirochaetota bacterium]|nr:hypothetical protein [Spirochaetota bacterium]